MNMFSKMGDTYGDCTHLSSKMEGAQMDIIYVRIYLYIWYNIN